MVASTFPDEPGRGTVTVLDTRSYGVLARVRTGVESIGRAVDTERRTAFSANYADDTLTTVAVGR